MSLESAIATLVDAINANTAALGKLVNVGPAPTAAKSDAPAAEKAAKPAKEKAAKPAAPAADAAKAPSAKEVADAVMDIANTVNRDAAKKILTDHGAEKVSSLKPDQFTSVLAACAAVKAAPAAAAESSDSLI